MILGIGIDILETARMSKWQQDRGFLERFMHPQELEDALGSKEDSAMLFASRFSVKEAFGKALGTGLRGLQLKDIALDHDSVGRPVLALTGTALAAFRRIGGVATHVSLSHQDSMVAAVVIIEGAAAGNDL